MQVISVKNDDIWFYNYDLKYRTLWLKPVSSFDTMIRLRAKLPMNYNSFNGGGESSCSAPGGL